MTEQEWLTASEPKALNNYYANRYRERKARLLMLACCRRHPEFLKPDAVQTMVDLLTAHYADPTAKDEPFDSPETCSLHEALSRYGSATTSGPYRGLAFGVIAAAEPRSVKKRLTESFRYLVFSCTYDVAIGLGALDGKPDPAEELAQAALIREILGNPFRRVTIKPSWLTTTVLSLARHTYETEDFSTMPILADALQDAGCDNEAIVTHCRDETITHVRGCWLLDRLLGKK